jgi:hypothetical protein
MRDTLREVLLERGYRLKTWDTGRTVGGKSCVGYELTGPAGAVLFTGEDFGCSPLHAVDSDEALRALCGFLFLRPGDTDREYFDGYSAEQRAFAESSDCESLAFLYSDEGPGTFGEWADGEDVYGLPVVERDGERFAFAENGEAADLAARAAILESLWAFRSEFLRDYVPALCDDRARAAFDKMRETLCEDANELVRGMVGDRLDELVSDAIGADGRGHFLASYDGDEVDEGNAYLYRIG